MEACWTGDSPCPVAKDGDVILVDGEPGSGKSTLLAAIAGFQTPFAGLVLSLGYAAARLPQKLRREAIGYAGKAAPLLQGTLAANLQYRLRAPFEPRAMAELMEATGLLHRLTPDGAIARLPIRDGGQRLPGAEVQAIQIVRALAGAPRLVILDDVFDELGDAEAQSVASLLREYRGVVVVVSRRPEIRGSASRLWKVTAAGIAEQPLPGTSSASILPLSPRLKA